ncbi:MAG: 3'(2'),5'-bisphosphate nucleotidase CysQ family protein [Nanobdellota archaeon]
MAFESELSTLKQLMRSVGSEIMKIYDTEYSQEVKHDTSPVTEADLLSDKLLREGLSHFDYGILSEEVREGLPDHDRVWVIDPLDGTKDFINKTGEFSIMVGLLEKGQPVLGAVYLPVLDKMYYAITGLGAFVEHEGVNRRMRVTPNGISRMVISRNHFSHHERFIAEQLKVSEFIRCGSIGVKLGRISEGEADFYLNTSDRLGAWDCCAPEIILREAGGIVFNRLGQNLSYVDRRMNGGLIATNGSEKQRIIQQIARQ